MGESLTLHHCVVCGHQLFGVIRGRQTCSELCRLDRERAKDRAKYERQLERGHRKPSYKRRLEKQREERLQTIEQSPFQIRSCARCGTKFQIDRRVQVWRKYCVVCRSIKAKRYQRKCPNCIVCGELLQFSQKKFCSDSCKDAIRPHTPRRETCLYCTGPMPAKRHQGQRFYCSQDCGVQMKRQRNRTDPERRAKKHQRTHDRYVKMKAALVALQDILKITA